MSVSGRRNIVAAATTLTVLIGAGLVFAAWLTDGSGSGYAKAGQSQDLSTVDVSADAGTVTNKLYPGADGDVLIKIHNPNSYPVRVTAISGSGAITASGGVGTCTTNGVTFTDQTGLTIDVPAGGETTTTLTNAAHMDNTSDDGCQDATFTIPVALTGHSNAA